MSQVSRVNRHVGLRVWEGTEGDGALAFGTHVGTRLDGQVLVVDRATGTRVLDGTTYESAAWVSAEVRLDVGATELIGSWNAATPAGTWLELEARWARAGDELGRWYSLGRWAEDDSAITPTSVAGQADGRSSVEVDVLATRDGVRMASYQLRLTMYRLPGSVLSPRVRLLAASVSDVDSPVAEGTSGSAPSARGGTGIPLEVPAYSQQRHRDAYPEYSQGGASWCSPTATSMVLHFWELGPKPVDYAWVEESMPDRFVPHAARRTYDLAYGGTGNWAFNTAYAATFGARALVTRLTSLGELERVVGAGFPVVATVVFAEQDGVGYTTEGHLLVVVGFDESGDVVTNDPASQSQPSNDHVRTTFGRDLFEQAWLERSRGTVYLIHPRDVPLPL